VAKELAALGRRLKVLTKASAIPLLSGLSTGVKHGSRLRAAAISRVRYVAKTEPLSVSHCTLCGATRTSPERRANAMDALGDRSRPGGSALALDERGNPPVPVGRPLVDQTPDVEHQLSIPRGVCGPLPGRLPSVRSMRMERPTPKVFAIVFTG